MSDTKKVLVTDFVKKYNDVKSVDLKAKQIQGIIKRTYCPILEKKITLDLMLKKSVVEDDIPHIDIFVNKLNFYAAIISLYTYIVPEKDENDVPKSYEMYDLLINNNIMFAILEEIGERELSELNSVNGLLLDTWHMKHSSTEAYVTNLIETASQKFGAYAGFGMDKLADVLSDEKKMNKIMIALEKVAKKIK
jgi:hypothetical protein